MYTVHCGVVFIAFWMLHLDCSIVCSTVDVHIRISPDEAQSA